MKVALGSKIIKGPWGGGNLFTINLKNYLNNKNIEVTNSLIDSDIDIILLTEPRIESSTSTITLFEAMMYKKYVNTKVKLIHRINECDERKNTNFVNKKMIKISRKCDFTIYVSSWIETLYRESGINVVNSNVVMSGSDKNIFNKENKKIWNRSSKLKIITHHWGNNWNKGFDVYCYIDKLLDESDFSEKFEFTYVGNLPKNFSFKNVSYKKPLSGIKLSEELKANDLYITGSLNEPSGNHQIEASLCGLPVLYINSGGIPEYQKNFGIEFEINNLNEKFEEVHKNYDFYYKKNENFPYNSELMCENYLDIMKSIYEPKLENKKIGFYIYVYRFLNYFNFLLMFKSLLANLIYQFRKLRS